MIHFCAGSTSGLSCKGRSPTLGQSFYDWPYAVSRAAAAAARYSMMPDGDLEHLAERGAESFICCCMHELFCLSSFLIPVPSAEWLAR